jgi:hypothetical protein
MGVMPDLTAIFFKNPYLWSKMMFGPLTTHQYRLRNLTNEMITIILKQPYGDVLENIITITFLMITKIYNKYILYNNLICKKLNIL